MENTVTLPCGVVQPDGSVARDAVIRPLTGGVLRKLGTDQYQKNPEKILDLVMETCLLSIGGEPISRPLLEAVPTGDRDFLLLEVWSLTQGGDVSFGGVCPSCSHEFGIRLAFDEIKVYALPDEPGDVWELVTVNEKALYGKRRVWTAERPGLKVKFLFTRCGDMKKIKGSPVSVLFKTVTSSIYEWTENGEAVTGPFDETFLDSQPQPIVKWVLESFQSMQPGPELTEITSCPSCSADVTVSVDPTDFFGLTGPAPDRKLGLMTPSGS